MKLENQVASLELAKEMKELGAEQDSLWCWSRCAIVSSTECGQGEMKLMFGRGDSLPDRIEHYSAYTVAELGEMLPTFYTSWKTAGTWACGDELNQHGGKGCEAKTEADARAKMLILLLKAKIVKGKRRRNEQKK